MHILGHNPAVWVVVRVGVQGDLFGDERELDHDVRGEELNMLQYNAQACDILFNYLCPEDFNKISQFHGNLEHFG